MVSTLGPVQSVTSTNVPASLWAWLCVGHCSSHCEQLKIKWWGKTAGIYIIIRSRWSSYLYSHMMKFFIFQSTMPWNKKTYFREIISIKNEVEFRSRYAYIYKLLFYSSMCQRLCRNTVAIVRHHCKRNKICPPVAWLPLAIAGIAGAELAYIKAFPHQWYTHSLRQLKNKEKLKQQ